MRDRSLRLCDGELDLLDDAAVELLGDDLGGRLPRGSALQAAIDEATDLDPADYLDADYTAEIALREGQ